jgi:hypothetical protein
MSPSRTCPQMASCALYARFSQQSFLRIWQITYCEADHMRCERFQRTIAGGEVPLNLLPNGTTLGEKPARKG